MSLVIKKTMIPKNPVIIFRNFQSLKLTSASDAYNKKNQTDNPILDFFLRNSEPGRVLRAWRKLTTRPAVRTPRICGRWDNLTCWILPLPLYPTAKQRVGKLTPSTLWRYSVMLRNFGAQSLAAPSWQRTSLPYFLWYSLSTWYQPSYTDTPITHLYGPWMRRWRRGNRVTRPWSLAAAAVSAGSVRDDCSVADTRSRLLSSPWGTS